MTQQFDIIIVGAGPGGYEVAARQAAEGKRVLVIEKNKLGGTCLNRGCIPTKCLCAASSTVEKIAEAPAFGIQVGSVVASYAVAVERAKGVVDSLRAGVDAALAKCTVLYGEAVLQPDRTVKVGDDAFTAPLIILATGSTPASLNIPGADLAMSSDDFLRLTELPDSLVIIGGGVIGLEFAYIANTFGVDVTVVEYCKEILPPFDSEVAKRLRGLLSDKGITFITSAAVTSVAEADGGKFAVSYNDKKGEHTLTAGGVLMAVGRKAVVPRGAQESGIKLTNRGFIDTDDKFETSVKGVYAVGDCNGKLMLAHAATAQAMSVVGEDINLGVVPSAVFTHPEIAGVGLTTQQCKDSGINYVAKKSLYRANGKAMADGTTDGFVKLLVCPETDAILGCHILGAHASDLIQEATVAMANSLTVKQLCSHTIFGHPSLSEIIAAAL